MQSLFQFNSFKDSSGEEPIQPVIEMAPSSCLHVITPTPSYPASIPWCFSWLLVLLWWMAWQKQGSAGNAISIYSSFHFCSALDTDMSITPEGCKGSHSWLSVTRNNLYSRMVCPYLKHLARGNTKKIQWHGKTIENICCYWWKTVLLPSGISQWGPRPNSSCVFKCFYSCCKISLWLVNWIIKSLQGENHLHLSWGFENTWLLYR